MNIETALVIMDLISVKDPNPVEDKPDVFLDMSFPYGSSIPEILRLFKDANCRQRRYQVTIVPYSGKDLDFEAGIIMDYAAPFFHSYRDSYPKLTISPTDAEEIFSLQADKHPGGGGRLKFLYGKDGSDCEILRETVPEEIPLQEGLQVVTPGRITLIPICTELKLLSPTTA